MAAGDQSLINSLAKLGQDGKTPEPLRSEVQPSAPATEPTRSAMNFTLGELGPLDQKKQIVAATAEAKKQAMRGIIPTQVPDLSETLLRQAVMQDMDSNLYADTYLSDVGTMTRSQLIAKYGEALASPEAMRQVADAFTQKQILQDNARTGGEKLQDAGVGLVAGIGRLGQTVQGIDSYVSDKIEDLTGVEIYNPVPQLAGELGGRLAESMQGRYSDGTQSQERLAAIQNSISAEENKNQFEIDKAGDDSDLEASLKRVGRDAGDAISNAIDNPATIQKGIAESMADVAVSGGIGGVAKAAGRKALGVAVQPVVSGLQEGGAAYGQAKEMVDGFSDEELQKQSHVYRGLRQDMGEAEAREQVTRNMAGKMFQDSFMAGTVLGNITKRFDAAPLTGGLLRSPVNVIGEAVEEGGMGVAGGLSQNEAAQENLDSEQDMLAGVGQQAGEGALIGAGLAGTLQGPAAATSATIGAVAAGVGAVEAGVQNLHQAAKTKLANNAKAASGNAPEAQAAAMQNEAALTSSVDAALAARVSPAENDNADNPAVAPAAAAPVADPVNEDLQFIRDRVTMPADGYADTEPQIQEMLKDEQGALPTTQREFIQRAAGVLAEKKDLSAADKEQLHIEIYNRYHDVGQLGSDRVQGFLAAADDGVANKAEIQEQITQTAKGFVQLGQLKEVKDSLRYVENILAQQAAPTEVKTDAEANTVIAMAEVAPEKLTQEAVTGTLNIKGKRNLPLPQRTQDMLTGALDLSRYIKMREDVFGEVDASSNGRKGAITVRDNIVQDGYDGEDGTGPSKRSIIGYWKDVNQLVKQGKIQDAKDLMTDLGHWTQTEFNKLGAFDASAKDGGKRKAYEIVGNFFDKQGNPKVVMSSDRKGESGLSEYWFNPKSENSVNLYRMVFADTSLIAATQATLAKAFPELGVEPVQLPNLSRSIGAYQHVMNKNLQAVVEANGGGAPAPTTPAVEPAATPVREAKPVVQAPFAPVEAQEAASTGADAKVKDTSAPTAAGDQTPAGGIADAGQTTEAVGATQPASTGSGSSQAGNQETAGADIPPAVNDNVDNPEAASDLDVTEDSLAEDVADFQQEDQTDPPEQTEEEDQTEDQGEAAPRSLDQEYGHLPAFTKRFKPVATKSRVIAEAVPAKVAFDHIRSEMPDGNAKEAYLGPIRKLVFDLMQKADARLNKMHALPHTQNQIKQYGLDGVVSRNYNMRHLALATEKGFDPKILQVAALATVDWMMSIPISRKVDLQEELAKAGISWDGRVKNKVASAFTEYTQVSTAVSQISDSIKRILGVDYADDVSLSESQGILEGMAKEMLDLLISEGFLEELVNDKGKAGISVLSNGRFVTMTGVRPNPAVFKTPATNNMDLRSVVAREPRALVQGLIEGMEKTYKVGPDAVPAVRKTQMHSSVPITKMEEKALTHLNQIKYFANRPLYDLIGRIGPETIKRWQGKITLTPENRRRFSETHLLTVEGRNQQLDTAMDEVDAAIQALSEVDGDAYDQVELHFNHEVSSVGRFQQEGPAAPQSNKTARALLRSTWSELDLSNPFHNYGFWISVAQMSGAAKPQNVAPKVGADATPEERAEDLAGQMREAVYTKFGPLIAHLRELEQGQGEPDLELMGKHLNGKELVVLEALQNVARYENHLASPQHEDSFRTSTPFEADGVTNGPANLIQRMMTGIFTPHELIVGEMVGRFFTETPKSLHDKAQNVPTNDQGQVLDLYSGSVEATKRALVQRHEMMDYFGGEVADIKNAAERFLARFAPLGLSLKEGIKNPSELIDNEDNPVEAVMGYVWQATRDAAKNPLTKQGYGAGRNSTARGVTSEIMDTFFKEMSRHLHLGTLPNAPDEYPELYDDLKLLTSGRIKVENTGKMEFQQHNPKIHEGEKPEILAQGNLRKMTLNASAFEHLAQNLKVVYVDPLSDGIESMVGNSFRNMSKLVEATNFQTGVVAASFNVWLDNYLKDHGRLPTPAEIKALNKSLKPLGVMIDTGIQRIRIGGAMPEVVLRDRPQTYDEKGKPKPIGTRTVFAAKTFGSRHEEGSRIDRPQMAGVAAAPNLNIATGDGQMMLRAIAIAPVNEFEFMQRILTIFDGQELPADAVEAGSEMVNAAVFKSWNDNIVRVVADQFTNFTRNLAMSDLFRAMTDDTGTFTLEGEKALRDEIYARTPWLRDTYRTMSGYAQLLRGELEEMATDLEARNKARSDFSQSIDQMAGAKAPYIHKGKLPAVSDPVEMARLLNERMEHYQDKPKQIEKINKKSNENLDNKIAEISAKVPGTKTLRVVDWRNLPDLTKMLPYQQRAIYERIIKGKIDAGYQIFTGDAQEMEAYRQRFYEDPYAVPLTDVGGQIDLQHQVIFLPEVAGETLLHEAIHAVLGQNIRDVFAGTITEGPIHEAVGRLHLLADEFVNLTFDDGYSGWGELIASPERTDKDGKFHPAVLTPLGQILADFKSTFTDPDSRQIVDDERMVQEFAAYVLTNPVLGKVAKQQQVQNKLALIWGKMLALVKRVLGIPSHVGNDFFSQVSLNAEILARNISEFPELPPPAGPSGERGRSLNSRKTGAAGKANPTGKQAQSLRAKLSAMIRASLPEAARKTGNLVHVGRAQLQAYVDYDSLGDAFRGAGFQMNDEEQLTFQQVMMVFASPAVSKMNPTALVRAQEIYTAVLDQLDEQSFEKLAGNDPMTSITKYRVLLGMGASRKDAKGRSSILPAFLALAAVSDEFRSVLNQLELPKKKSFDSYRDVDAFLTSTTENAIQAFSKLVVREMKESNAKDATENVLARLVYLEEEKLGTIEGAVQNWTDMADAKLAGLIQDGTDFLAPKVEAVFEKTMKREGVAETGVNLLAGMTAGIIGIMNKEKGKIYGEMVSEMTTQLPSWLTPLQDMFGEIRGMTDTNKSIYRLLDPVRKESTRVRNTYRSGLPAEIAKQFTREMTDGEWALMHKAYGQTDASFLLGQRKFADVAKLYTDDQHRAAEITSFSRRFHAGISKKAGELAEYLMTGKTAPFLLANAHAILDQERGYLGLNNEQAELHRADLDTLITLMAIELLDPTERKAMGDLIAEQGHGMEFSLAVLKFWRDKEHRKNYGKTETVRMNQWKGFIPAEDEAGVSVVVRDTADHTELIKLGYVKIRDYEGDSIDPDAGKLAYYHTPVNARNPFTQGVMQTTEVSKNGIDIKTGRSVTGRTAGGFGGRKFKKAQHNLSLQTRKVGPGEHLRPIFNEEGHLAGYERMMAPDMVALKQKNFHFAEMLGAWAGRQEEEKAAVEFNKKLVAASFDVWKNDKSKYIQDTYENLATSKDPVMQDIWNNVIPRDMKEEIAATFGRKDFFPVRKDMRNLVVGYRAAGVSDTWTGISRNHEESRKAIADILDAYFGPGVIRNLIKAERAWQAGVSELRNWIVVRSVIVPIANLVSNMGQLSLRGVPWSAIGKKGVHKFNEINRYLANEQRGIALQAELQAAQTPVEKNRIRAQIQSIRDANKRMSIWPLIESGKFATIAEGLEELDPVIRNGQVVRWIEEKIDELPDGMKTIGNYAIVSKSTALYKGLNRMTQYGDFLAKAILYDDLMERRGMDQAEALDKITEEFVNFNVPPGRARSYLESMGLMMFWNFKLRIMKVAVSMIRENPARLLIHSLLPNPVDSMISTGSPITDNAVAVVATGRGDYALGLDMLIDAPGLNPWYNLIR